MTFDIARRIQYLTVDIITHLYFGAPLGFVETHSDVYNFLSTIERQLPIVQHFSVIIEINTFVERILRWKWLKSKVAPKATDKTGTGMIMGVSRNLDKYLAQVYTIQPSRYPRRRSMRGFNLMQSLVKTCWRHF